MPSTSRQIMTLVQHLFARFVWLFLARNPETGGRYGNLKSLSAKEFLVLLTPAGLYAAAAVWVYLMFPRTLIPYAGTIVVYMGLCLTSMVVATLVATRIIDWHHRYV